MANTISPIKFNRNYVLSIASRNDGPVDIVITLPFTIEFDITRNTLTSSNVCQIRIYNLSSIHRDQLRFNQSDFGNYRPIILAAGYNNNLPIIFQGNITQAWSVREGTNFITQIECFDGGLAYKDGKVDLGPGPAGETLKSVVTRIAATLPRISIGAISFFLDNNGVPKTLSRPISISSVNTMQTINDMTGGKAFIDREKINILSANEYIADSKGPTVINSQSGLLNTPIREQSKVTFDMIFEPSLEPGRLVLLDSITGPGFNNNVNSTYEITGVKHHGMISAAVCGNVITTGEFSFLEKLIPVAPVTQ